MPCFKWSLHRSAKDPFTPNLVQMSKLMIPHMNQTHLKWFITHIIRLSKESWWLPRRYANRAGKGDWLEIFIMDRGWVQVGVLPRVGQGLHGWNFPLATKDKRRHLAKGKGRVVGLEHQQWLNNNNGVRLFIIPVVLHYTF